MSMQSSRLVSMLAVVAALALYPVVGQAQQAPPTIAKPIPPDTPVRNELGKIFERLTNDVKQADALVARLREIAQKTPEAARAEVNNAATLLGNLADRLKPTGDIAGQLQALRNAATVHRKRVADLAPNLLDEADRQAILDAWDATLRDTDNAAAAMADMRSKLMSALENLRMRQTAMAELVLAGQYQAAVEAMKKWLVDLEATVGGLHKVLEPAKPTS